MAQRSLSSKVKKSVQSYIKVLEKDRLPIDQVLVFGSQAGGTAYPDSDIDVCVVSSKFKNSFDALHYLLLKSYEIDAPIEPYPFHPREFTECNSLALEIKRMGIAV